MTDVLTVRKRMYQKQKERVKMSMDLNKDAANRLAEIKYKQKLPVTSIVNELMDKTICLDWETKKRLLDLLQREVTFLHVKYKNTDEKDVLWRTSLLNQADKLEELVHLLNL